MSSHWKTILATVAVAGSCVSCGAAPGSDEFTVGDEELSGGETIGTTSEAAVVGCAATVVSSESHSGWLSYASPTSIFIDRLEYRIKNPSGTDCVTMSITFQLKDDIYGTVIRQGSLTTSLRAGNSRTVYWDRDYESTTYWVNAALLRNGSLIKQTYVPGYFIDTGQY
jgi:hypothetical protein